MLTKSGTGMLQLGDSAWTNTANAGTYKNDFTSVQINAGTLRYGSKLALGTGAVTMEDGTTLIKIGEEGNGATLAMANNFVLNGQVTLRTVFSGIKDQWFSGVISGPGGIRITGERRAITLTGNNTFSGGVTMENYEGTAATALYNLDIAHANALGTGTLTVKTKLLAGLTQFRGLGASVALTAGSGVTNDIAIDPGATFYVGRGQNLRLGGDISGAGELFKRNTTTVILDGTNTYGGGTKVEAGILTIGGSLADATMNITGGTVDGTGTLTCNIDGTTADQIVMSGGTLTATGLKLAIKPTGAGLTQAEYVLVNATAGTITGTFASITGAPGYELNYATAGQVKLVRTATPYATWSGGAAADLDANADGVANGAAWALGATGPNVTATHLLPTVDNTTDPDYFLFKFNRSDPANEDPNTAIEVQYGSDLAGWTTAVDDNDNVDIITTPGSPTDEVVVKLKRATLGAGGTLFARLKVAVTTP
jgi:autotransporter-associated beta strand protein